MPLYRPFQSPASCLNGFGQSLRFGIGEPAGGMVDPHRARHGIERRERSPADGLNLFGQHVAAPVRAASGAKPLHSENRGSPLTGTGLS